MNDPDPIVYSTSSDLYREDDELDGDDFWWDDDEYDWEK